MTSCSKRPTRRTSHHRAPAFSFPALRGRVFWLLVGLVWLVLWPALALSAAGPIRTDFPDDIILAHLPDSDAATANPPSTARALADNVQTLLNQARATGDPRFLGYAERRLQQWPEAAMTDRLLVLRATLAQSLHLFEDARRDLTAVIGHSADRQQRIQARLTLANLDTVQGRYSEAREHCQWLSEEYPGLIAASCQAQVDARSGNASTAYDQLKARLAAEGHDSATGYLWALGTLGDIAAQLGLAAAETHWRTLLKARPTDLYTRTQLADWYWRRGRLSSVLTLTQDYEQVDALAVVRVIALRDADHPDWPGLAGRLRERFTEAQWRGALLHKRDFVRFLLTIEQQPVKALSYAMANWQSQREPLDTALALQAAIEAGDPAALRMLRQWLESTGQTDARYPEAL